MNKQEEDIEQWDWESEDWVDEGLGHLQLYVNKAAARYAYRCFLRGHKEGDATGSLYAALCLLCGSGVRRDLVRACEMLETLAEKSEHEDSYVWSSPHDIAHMLLYLLAPLLMPYQKKSPEDI